MKNIIISDERILGGKPIIKGTRISVELIMNFLSSGMTVDEIVKEYYELKKDEVFAAIKYAAKLVTKKNIALTSDLNLLPQPQ